MAADLYYGFPRQLWNYNPECLENLRKCLSLFLQGFDKLLFCLQIFLDLAEFQHGCPVVPAVMGCLQLGLRHLNKEYKHTGHTLAHNKINQSLRELSKGTGNVMQLLNHILTWSVRSLTFIFSFSRAACSVWTKCLICWSSSSLRFNTAWTWGERLQRC